MNQSTLSPIRPENNNQQGTQVPLHNEICKHFKNGSCQKGKDCPYLHIYRIGDLKTDKKPEKHIECPYYQQGFCPDGNNCKYKHTHLSREYLPDPGYNTTLNLFVNNIEKEKVYYNTSIKLNLCDSYKEGMKCKYADNCNHSHGEQDDRILRMNHCPIQDLHLPTQYGQGRYFIFNYDTLSLLSDSLTRGEITLPIKYALTINHYIKENHSIYFFYHVRTRDQNHFRAVARLNCFLHMKNNNEVFAPVTFLRTMEMPAIIIENILKGERAIDRCDLYKLPVEEIDLDQGYKILVFLYRYPSAPLWSKFNYIPNSVPFTDGFYSTLTPDLYYLCRGPGCIVDDKGDYDLYLQEQCISLHASNQKIRNILFPGSFFFLYRKKYQTLNGPFQITSRFEDHASNNTFQFTFRPYSTPLEVDFYEFRSILDNPSTSILSLQQVSQILSIFIQHSSQPLPFPSKFQYNFCYEQEVNIEHEEFQSSEKLMKNPYFQLLYRSLDVGYVELRGKTSVDPSVRFIEDDQGPLTIFFSTHDRNMFDLVKKNLADVIDKLQLSYFDWCEEHHIN